MLHHNSALRLVSVFLASLVLIGLSSCVTEQVNKNAKPLSAVQKSNDPKASGRLVYLKAGQQEPCEGATIKVLNKNKVLVSGASETGGFFVVAAKFNPKTEYTLDVASTCGKLRKKFIVGHTNFYDFGDLLVR